MYFRIDPFDEVVFACNDVAVPCVLVMCCVCIALFVVGSN